MRAFSIVAMLAIVVLAFLAGKSIEDESQSQHQQQRAHTKKKEPARLPPYRAPQVDGRTYNLEVVWWKHKGRFLPESVAWTKHDLVNKPGEAHLIVTPEGVRIKLRNPKAEVVKVNLYYDYASGSEGPCSSWNGQGFTPLTKTIRTKDGKKRTVHLAEISLRAYDPRFLQGRKPPHTDAVMADVPSGTASVS